MSLPSSPNWRWLSVTATISAAAATHATCTRPVSTWLAGPEVRLAPARPGRAADRDGEAEAARRADE